MPGPSRMAEENWVQHNTGQRETRAGAVHARAREAPIQGWNSEGPSCHGEYKPELLMKEGLKTSYECETWSWSQGFLFKNHVMDSSFSKC